MLVVGLTGGIGSGKSTVAKMFVARGATVIDADRIAREVVAPGTVGLAAVVAEFGTGVLNADGSLDRARLGQIVFRDSDQRRALERIVHPAVAAETAARIAAAMAAGAELVVYDVPLLYENGLEKNVAAVVVVNVSPERQRERIRSRDDLDDQQIEDRIEAQMPLAEKVARADYVIDNDGTIEHTEEQVAALVARLTETTP